MRRITIAGNALKHFIKRFLAWTGYEIRKRPRPLIEHSVVSLRFDLSYILAHLLLRHPAPFIVQVGAYDGVANDPLREYVCKYRLPGLLVEPQAVAFDRLTVNYADQPQLSICRAAVAEQDGLRDLYQIDPTIPGLPEWAGQTATFRRDILLSLRGVIPDVESQIISEQVQCRTFESLFQEHGVCRVDILQVDTEGFDFEILKLFPFDRFLPYLVRYEHHHLSTTDQDTCIRMLAGLGYAIHVPDHAGEDYMDTLAYRPFGNVLGRVMEAGRQGLT